jgi:hypothetical protein
MAITTETIPNPRNDPGITLEIERAKIQAESQARQLKIDCIRMAKEIITDNKRNMPVGDREITYQEIIDFAVAIENHVNS